MSGSSKKSGHTGSPERADYTRLEGKEKANNKVKKSKSGRERRVRPDGAIVRDRSHRHRRGGTGR